MTRKNILISTTDLPHSTWLAIEAERKRLEASGHLHASMTLAVRAILIRNAALMAADPVGLAPKKGK